MNPGRPRPVVPRLSRERDGVLVNTAIAESHDPIQMAIAFRGGVEAGRLAHLAGRMPVRTQASPSSPVSGVVTLAQPEVPA